MSGVLMALGPHRFFARGPSYERLERTFAGRWAGIELIGLEPVQRFGGPGEVSHSLDGVVYPFALDGADTLDDLEKEVSKGQGLMLVSGTGLVFGRFGLREVRLTGTMAWTRGEPQKIEFSLDLVRVARGQGPTLPFMGGLFG